MYLTSPRLWYLVATTGASRFPEMPRQAAMAAGAAASSIAADEASNETNADSSPSGSGAAAADRRRLNSRMPLSDDEVVATDAFKIMVQFKTQKDIRISVKGEYWDLLPNLHGTRLQGTIMQWSRKEPPDRKIRVLWPDGHDTEVLNDLFHPEVDLVFLPYANGKPAPQLVGRAAARQARERLEQDRASAEQIAVEYLDGGIRKEQIWTVERPEGVTVDQRVEDWLKPRLNRDLKTLNTPYRMWQRAALPIALLTDLQKFVNQRLDGENNDYDHRETSVGELIQFFSYMGAIAIERGYT